MKKKLTADEREYTQINSSRKDSRNKDYKIKTLKNPRLSAFICGLISALSISAILYFSSSQSLAEDSKNEIETALYTRQEFFGAEAIVPLPTSEARENLALIAENSAENPAVLEKLAELDEKLENYAEAEKLLIRLSEIDALKTDALAAFYHRRADFGKEAEVLRKLLFTTDVEQRADVFERLIETARIHDLKAYLNADFYAEVVRENPSAHLIFETLIDNLVEEKNYAEALKFVRQAKAQFPERRNILLDKEIEILLETNQPKEAEMVYSAAFDPFWSDAEADKFYEFLSEHDRLREYGAELKAKFKKNPADFDAGIRLALYQNHDYSYGNDEITPIITKIEAAKKIWTTGELITATRLLLRENDGATASRFLYTLYLREDFQENPEQRAQILYQLSEMFSDAENQKLPLTKGDLRFYEDVARADTNPGITTGILSLIFSDTKPKQRLEEQENAANKFFNRAAAYRIFEEYKKESPTTSPQLARMYLDITELYLRTKEPEIAEKTLNEFAERYENSVDYPGAAMKLADGFSAMKNEAKAREIYRKVLDFTGRQGKPLAPKAVETADNSETDSSGNYSYNDEPPNNFTDYLADKNEETTYNGVLEIYVDSLAKEKKTAEILALYSGEIAKYPNEEWLYERRLTWLEQTNLTDEKLQFYKASLARFQTSNWRDKLARFFVREKRDDEFSALSEDLVGKLNDAEIQNYLAQFVDREVSSGEFKERLYLKLYQSAHARFPHNFRFVEGLLSFYKAHKLETEWRKLSAEYYFESKEIREAFLNRLAEKGELRSFLQNAQSNENTVYELFRADASARLSDYENAVAAYRKLNRVYPHTPEFSERLIDLTRSFGQKNRQTLTEAAAVSQSNADFEMSSAEYRTRSGEIFAELGNYEKSRGEWDKLIPTASGDREIYLDAATVYWDYFQYDDALRTIKNLREKFADDTLYAFETGAILEAQDKQTAAIGEYVKAFDAERDDGQKAKAQKRLTKLAAKNSEVLPAVNSAFATETAKIKNTSFLALGYAEFLTEIKQNDQAELVLNRAIAQSQNAEFLEAARDFYQTEDNKSGEQNVLKRLAATSKSPRRSIRFRLQLATSYEEAKQRDAAKIVLANLVRQFPTNYGVLTETSDVYWRLGFETEAVNVLQNALPKSKGAYQNTLSSKLSERLIQTNQLNSAERILTKLHDENPADAEIFHELANVCVRTNNSELMRKAFDETVKTLRTSEVKDRRELDGQIADLRVSMIDAFTRTKDFRSAVEQHIEIINREPENEELTENAVRYVRRYGGADVLRDYYLKLSAEAFKNYRWNVVLARIYEANKDAENAVKNYQAAIVNQPEMPELYLAVADIETSRNNFDAALRNLDTVLELTNDAPQYVIKKIEILKKAGRTAEIEAEKAKLPAVEEKKITTDEFAEARKLDFSEKEKARALYREAFGKLLENPLNGAMKTADIAAYVNSVREEEPLNQINERLWNLREKLIEIADEDNSTNAGEARNRRQMLDGAMTETIGNIAVNYGTDEELAALHENLRTKIDESSLASDRHQTVSLIQDLSVRAGFGDLEETILQKKLTESVSGSDRKIYVRNLVNFYNERGAYKKTFDVLEKYELDDLPLKAETARLVGNREKELEALRAIYWKPADKFAASDDANVARFLEILHAENREELKSVCEKSSVYQLQTINFLLGKGERELAHTAIENAALPLAWKASRHAETSLALKEFDDSAECYFCAALQFDSIGNLIRQTPDKKSFLINDDWFRLTREYGEWLFEKQHKTISPSKFLTAMSENQPDNADEQLKLGEFYLRKKDFGKAIEHLRLAIETENSVVEDETKLTTLGAAYYLSGDVNSAEITWAKVFADEENSSVESGLLFFDVLQKYGLSRAAREKMPPIIIGFLENSNAENSEEFQQLVRKIAASFDNETEKTIYFRRILEKRSTDKSLAAMLLNENLITGNEQKEFYELLISRHDKLDYGDYNFSAVRERFFGGDDAESIYEQENDYKVDEPENERVEWQRKYLEYLLERRENSRMTTLIAAIEKDLTGFYARPAWLRLAKININIRENKFDRTDAERFIGITVSDAATEINPPNLERFNEVRRLLTAEKHEAEALQLSEAFYARMFALGQFEAANFVGFARVFFQKDEPENALRVLQLMVNAGDETNRETALAEISALEIVKARNADATKIEANETALPNQIDALKLAAEISSEYNQNDAAIKFRRRLLETNPNDSDNKTELAKLLADNGEKAESENLLTQIIRDRNALRAARWRARSMLSAEMPNAKFDSFSQFYNGTFAARNGQNEAAFEFFSDSLIADKDAATGARPELIKLYALSNQPFAALKFAATDKSAKSDELLQTLSAAAEKIGDFQKAIEFERAKSNGGNAGRVAVLQRLFEEKNRRATDFTVNAENTKKL